MAGATFDVIVLSSSPPAPAPHHPLSSQHGPPRRVAMTASSPVAFSPPSSPKRASAGASRINSRAAPIPEGASRGFATVGSLVRSEHFASQVDTNFARRGSLEVKEDDVPSLKKARKRAAPKTDGKGEKPKTKPRARKVKTDKDPAARDPELRLPPPKKSPFFDEDKSEPPSGAQKDPKLTKAGKPRKPRAKKKKPEEAAQSCPKEAQSAVDGLGTLIPLDDQNARLEEASIWEVPKSPPPRKKKVPKSRPPESFTEALDLDAAVTRRRDWTPPPQDTAIVIPSSGSIGKENKEDTDGAFTHLLSNFTYIQAPKALNETTKTATSEDIVTVTKRRRVDLVEVPRNQAVSRNSSPEKGKAPKKKPRTITDLVTGQYAPRELGTDSHAPLAENDFFESRTHSKKIPLNDIELNADSELRIPPVRRKLSKANSEQQTSKSKAKKPSTKSTAKSRAIAEKLLSPASAALRMSRQDVLFGTSSQLALEESPTMIRHIQRALSESEQDVHQVSAFRAPPPRWPNLDKVKGKRGLWAASSRNDEGGMLDHAEDEHVIQSHRKHGGHASQAEITRSDPESGSDSLPLCGVDFEGVDDSAQGGPPPSNQNVDSNTDFSDILEDILMGSPVQRDGPAIKSVPSPPALVKPPSDVRSKPRNIEKPSQKLRSPPFEFNNDVLRYSPSTPARTSGRFINIEEILDSEDEILEALSPTPPRVGRLEDAGPLPLTSLDGSPPKRKGIALIHQTTDTPDLLPVSHCLASNLLWENSKGAIFEQITTHVRSLAPSTDLKKPTWHEKILMYHPIVLEDFTSYLNTISDIHAYKRATQKQIKAWNQDLKRRALPILSTTEGSEEVLVVRKELEPYMVQGWCESMSICCIWGEGRGKGGARKGLY
ncbi:hypothetical protein IQ07DRAFT_36093 [Pyrenochaeta sp. DS3sAY3a]|nr:hypothetical protein IQ07DRAFT_36093 [Pyrenochaeta sp. DS3sAY3a]